MESARAALELIDEAGGTSALRLGVAVLSELSAAIGGDADAVDRVLEVLERRLPKPIFPRLADHEAQTNAA
jgi:hypothetical protein